MTRPGGGSDGEPPYSEARMARSDSEATIVVDSPADQDGGQRVERVARGPAGSPFAIYKPGQGAYVRWGTALGAAVLTVGAALYAYDRLQLLTFVEDPSVLLWIRTIVAIAILAGLSFVGFWLIGQKPRVVDFLIATEGEMRKVNWSTRKEVIGATKVVIVAVLLLGFILFVVDLLFIAFFSGIGVIRIPILKAFLGGGPE